MVTYRPTKLAPSSQVDSPSKTTTMVTIVPRARAATSNVGITRVNAPSPDEIGQKDQHGDEAEGDLYRALQDYRERIVRSVLHGQLNAHKVFDGVAGDCHNDEAREGLRHVQLRERRSEGRNEPI